MFSVKVVGTRTTTAAFSLPDSTTALASNYSLANTTGLSANITKKDISISGLSRDDKVYDGTTVASIIGTAALLTAIAPGSGTTTDGTAYSGDIITIDTSNLVAAFNDRDVLNASIVNFTGLVLVGADAGNYNLLATQVLPHGLPPRN